MKITREIVMKTGIIIWSIFLCVLSFSQSDPVWKEKEMYLIDSSDIWQVDILGNTYITRKEVVHKYDSLGILKFSQSQKAIGRLSSIQAVNAMKLIAFSEEQQMFCFLDNTLTPYESCVELVEQGIGNASLVAVSAQPDKFWVYDQLNSHLHLLSLAETDQAQEIENLKGVLNSVQISYMLEQNSLLYLVDPQQGLYVLDMYGSLVNSIKQPGIKAVQADTKYVYLLKDNYLLRVSLKTGEETRIKCPVINIREFKKNGSSYYFRTGTEIKKYQLLFTE